MIDLALDQQTGDLILYNFDLGLVDKLNQVIQNLAIRLRFIRGEWFLNIDAGIPYYQYFFVKKPNRIQIESFIINEIVTTRNISQLTEFSSGYDAVYRRFRVRFKAISDYGVVEFDEELL